MKMHISFNPQGSALLMNQSFAFKFLCENFQQKLINSYSIFKKWESLRICLGYEEISEKILVDTDQGPSTYSNLYWRQKISSP